jgi:hypothetical protein
MMMTAVPPRTDDSSWFDSRRAGVSAVGEGFVQGRFIITSTD